MLASSPRYGRAQETAGVIALAVIPPFGSYTLVLGGDVEQGAGLEPATSSLEG